MTESTPLGPAPPMLGRTAARASPTSSEQRQTLGQAPPTAGVRIRTDDRIRPGEETSLRTPPPAPQQQKKNTALQESSGRGFRDCTAACSRETKHGTGTGTSTKRPHSISFCCLPSGSPLCPLCPLWFKSQEHEPQRHRGHRETAKDQGNWRYSASRRPEAFFFSCCRLDSPLCRLQSSQFLSILRGESLFRANRERYQRRHGRARHSSRLTHSKAGRPKNTWGRRDACAAPVHDWCAVIRR
jgi:hypothetical protein